MVPVPYDPATAIFMLTLRHWQSWGARVLGGAKLLLCTQPAAVAQGGVQRPQVARDSPSSRDVKETNLVLLLGASEVIHRFISLLAQGRGRCPNRRLRASPPSVWPGPSQQANTLGLARVLSGRGAFKKPGGKGEPSTGPTVHLRCPREAVVCQGQRGGGRVNVTSPIPAPGTLVGVVRQLQRGQAGLVARRERWARGSQSVPPTLVL